MAALLCNLVPFDSPVGTGTTAVTGVGFQGKLAIIFGTRSPGTQGLASAFRVGVDDGVHRYARAVNPGLFVGVHVADGYMSNAYSIVAMRTQGTNELMLLGYLQSFDPDGFTVKWDFNLVATGVRFYALVLGGTDFNATVFGFQPTTSPFSVTTPGWTPTGLFGIHLGDTFATTLLPGNGGMAFGYAGAPACGQCTDAQWYESFPASGLVNAWGYQRSGEWLSTVAGNSGAVTRRTILTAMDALGFTVTNTGQGTYACAAVQGCAVNVGVFTQPLVPGLQAVPIPMGTGRVVVLSSFGAVANTAAVPDFLLSFGVGAVGGQKAVWTGALAGSPSERADSVQDDSALGVVYTPTGNYASTLAARVRLSGFTNGFLNLIWDQVDGLARQWAFQVYGDVGTGACGESPIPPSPGLGACFPADELTGDVVGSGCRLDFPVS